MNQLVSILVGFLCDEGRSRVESRFVWRTRNERKCGVGGDGWWVARVNRHFFEVEIHSFKFAINVWDDQHPSSVANTNKPLVGVI